MDAAKKKKGFLKPSTRENFCIYWYNFRSNKLSMVGLAIVVISLIFAIFAPYVAPFPEHAGAYVDLANAGVAPNATFWFGTDVTGRDILSRVIFGFRGALKMAVVVLAISVPVGTFLGLLAGYYHHTWVDTVIMRMTDIFLALPSLVLAMTIASLMEPNMTNTMIAVTLSWWPWYTRLVYSMATGYSKEYFIKNAELDKDGAGRWLGYSAGRIPEFYRPGRTAPHAVLRHDDLRRVDLHAGLLVDDGIPRPCHCVCHPWL